LRALLLAILALGAAGCSGVGSVRCEDPSRYATSTSAPPVRIPDELSPPDESQALRIPPPVEEGEAPPEGCLESPPPYVQPGAPG
jgi:uncharacterized lipoprotein